MPSFFHSSRAVLFALTLTLAGCAKRAEPIDAAQSFFQQIAAGKTAEAYAASSFAFQALQNVKSFEIRARELDLTSYAGAEWQPTEYEGRTAKVGVTITTRAGAKLPLHIVLVDEGGAWRIYSLKSPPSSETGRAENSFSLVGKTSAFTDASALSMPEEKEVRRLTRETLVRFNEAIALKSFDTFYDFVSRKWQDQLTKGQLARAFQPFIEKEIDLSLVAELEPVFDKPAFISSDGLLVVTGSYPTKPYITAFELKFVYELPKWKVFGLEVNLYTPK